MTEEKKHQDVEKKGITPQELPKQPKIPDEQSFPKHNAESTAEGDAGDKDLNS